jgi:hypothetical protein
MMVITNLDWRMTMWKAVLAGATAVAITGTSVVYAQQQVRGQNEQMRGSETGRQWQPAQEDRAAFADARLAALKAGLRLTPEQENNWPAFETALREFAKSRHDRATAQPNEQPTRRDPVERLRRQADALSNAGATLKRLADAEEPLYKSLDDGQKRRFHILARMLAPRQAHMMMRDGRGQDWRGGGERGRGRDGSEGSAQRRPDRRDSGQDGQQRQGRERQDRQDQNL